MEVPLRRRQLRYKCPQGLSVAREHSDRIVIDSSPYMSFRSNPPHKVDTANLEILYNLSSNLASQYSVVEHLNTFLSRHSGSLAGTFAHSSQDWYHRIKQSKSPYTEHLQAPPRKYRQQMH